MTDQKKPFRVFRPCYTDGRGSKRSVSVFWIEIRDHTGNVRRFAGTRDESQTREFGQWIVKLRDCRKLGLELDPLLRGWLDRIPAKLFSRLQDVGLVDKAQIADKRTLRDHLNGFHQFLLQKGDTPKQIHGVMAQLKKIMGSCELTVWSDIAADKISACLEDLRKQGLSAQTLNAYLAAIKQFCSWFASEGYATMSPVEALNRFDAESDRRRHRRALADEEWTRLLRVTRSGPKRFGMTGPQRADLYQFALETGLRANELRTLTVSSFNFDAFTVTVGPMESKHREEDTVTIRPDAVEKLKTLCGGRGLRDRVFGGNSKLTGRTSEMIEADLETAGIPYCLSSNYYFDFHALRTQLGTMLLNRGVHPVEIQKRLRHADVRITVDRYIDRDRSVDCQQAIATFPS